MTDVRVPRLNTNDTGYVLLEWCVADGAEVAAGQPVAVVETSKASEELVAEASGVVRWLLREGTSCVPGAVIGRIGGPVDAPPDIADVTEPDSNTELAGMVVTDAAQALLTEHGISVDRVRALGRRVVRAADIRQLLEPAPAGDEDESLPLPAMQRAVAATVAVGSAVPAAFTVVRVDLPGGDGADVVELVLLATAAQRSAHPAFFARLVDDHTLRVGRGAQIGVTVDVGHGLYLPVLRDAELLSLRDIRAALLRFRVKARRHRFSAADLSGANIGVTLHTESTVVIAQPVIYPGHTCALAVCAIQEEPRLLPDGSLGLRRFFHLGIAYDHRVVNGRDAVMFLDTIKGIIEREQPAD